MKKGLKFILITAGSLAAVGIICSVAALASVGFDFSKLSTDSEQTIINKTIEVAGTEVLTISDQYSDIKIQRSVDDDVHVRYSELNTKYTFTNDENAITIENASNGTPWYQNIQFFMSDVYETDDLVIALPEKFKGAVRVESDGNVTVEGVDLGDTLTIDTAFPVKVDSVSAKQIRITSENEVECKNCSVFGNMTVKGSFDIELDNIACDNLLECSSDSGTIEATGQLRANEIVFTSDIDSISFENADAQKFTASCTYSGDISGSFAGSMNDYTIYASSEYGDNCLKNARTQGERMLELSSVSGNIEDITFCDD